MAFYLHYLVLAPLALLALLALVVPGERPWVVMGRALRDAWTRRGGRWALGAYLFVVLVNLVEGLLDARLTAALGYDLTPLVRRTEGEFVARVQEAVLALPLAGLWVEVLSLLYTVGYVAWLLLPAFALHGLGRVRDAATYAVAFAVNYALALPFYLFAPVREVAWSGLSRARPLLEETWPGITADLRYESALDNCFPSLHVSIAVTALCFARRHGGRRLALVGWPLTLGIVLSVLVLGIHWGVDTAAGVPFGIVCARLAERLVPPGEDA